MVRLLLHLAPAYPLVDYNSGLSKNLPLQMTSSATLQFARH